MNKPVFALIDCNNFFVSCERLFRPDLAGKPVVVLSSNDGCAVSRSNEAKALGIPMAAPAFKLMPVFKEHGVAQFSANFELYGDISSRITTLLTSVTPHIEVYSVDESFLDLSELDISDYTAWAHSVRELVYKYVGIPVSIGIAGSKTLAKLAAARAKKEPGLNGALSFVGLDAKRTAYYLSRTPLQDIWGIGWRLAPKLKAEGLHTALDLRSFPVRRASQLMGVHGRQMITELQGTSCLPLQRHHKPQQMIMRGRQFGEDTGLLHVLEAAVASLTARAAATLRREQRLARQAVVVIRTNRNKPGYRKLHKAVTFATPTADTGLICAALIEALSKLHNPRELYHKADVLLLDLLPAEALQTDLLGSVDPAASDRSAARMHALDSLNARYGRQSIRFAAESLSEAWRPRHNLGSPRYTTDWNELPVARITSEGAIMPHG